MPKPSFPNIRKQVAESIRVNHAGEYGAKRIYQGQLDYIKDAKSMELINSMLDHEQQHLDYFDQQLKERKIRPTLLLPFWHFIGYLLGAASAITGINNAMLLTQNVEEVIEIHYQKQIKDLSVSDELTLINNIQAFMEEEVLHKEIAQRYNSNPFIWNIIKSNIIQRACKLAIFLSKKI